MKRILSTLTLLLCFAFTAVNAQVITAERAAEIANSFFSAGVQKSAAARGVVSSPSLTSSFDSNDVTKTASAEPTFYVLTNPEGGFVIVSGEETENPIIGYSLDGTIDVNNLPDGFVGYMTDIDAQVKSLREYNTNNPQKAAAARSAMQRAANFEYNATSMGNIVKNLNTAPWGQRTPFNNLCKTTDGQTALTGCGPTAFAILCYYYKWPASGVGTVTHQGTGENMELGHTYDYANMRNDNYSSGYSEAEANAIAVLMRDLGWANQVGYGTSSTSFSETGQHMVDHFRFKSERPVDHGASLAVVRSTLGNDTQWKTYIKNNLDAGYPIPYASTTNTSNSARHIYILDGYTDNDYYHFNWGWSGQGNGWFTLDNMVPDDYSNYSNSHKAYFNLIPDATTYTVRATATPSNMGTVSINGGTAGTTVSADLLQGVTATLTAHPAQGYALASWTKGGVVVGTRNTLEVTVGTDANDYVANFDDEANVIVVQDYTINATSGTELTGDKVQEWAFNTNNDYPAALKLISTAASINANNGAIQLFLIDKTSETYTLSVQEDYEITQYTIRCKATSSYNIKVAAEGQEITPTNSFADYKFERSNTLARTTSNSASFTVTGNSGRYMQVESITVTVAKEGANVPSTPTTYTINVNADTGGNAYVNGTNTSVTVDAGTDVTLQAYPDGTNYTFAGWYNGNSLVSSNNPYTFALNSNVTYTAKFNAAATTYTVTTTANPAAGGTAKFAVGTGSQKIQGDVENGTQITLYAVANTGYNFVNWTLGGNVVSTDATCNVNVAQAANYVANFEANVPAEPATNLGGKYFRLKVKNTTNYMNIANNTEHPGGTAGGVNVTAKNENYGGQIFQFIESGTGYKLLSKTGYYIKCQPWNVDAISVGTVLSFETAGADNKYFIKWDNTNMNDGVERDDYFKTQNVDGITYVYCDAALNAASTWVLEEVVYYTVTATAGEGGSVSPLTSTVEQGKSVTLTATANTGYRFVNWTLNGNVVSTDASYTFNATAAGEYVANFEISTYTISATANPGTAGSVTINGEAVSSKNVNENSTVTLVAAPQAGYCFVNWTKGGVEVSTDASYTFKATAAGEYVANFEQIVVNATLTDAQGNQYIVKLDGFTDGVTKDAVAAKLTEKYPYITLGTVENVITLNGSNGAYTYTNTVELPFKVSNATYIWHNIYYPANSNDNPNYIAALNEDEVVDMAASKDYAYGDNPTYNTKDGGNSICWAIYNVNNSFEFIFKSRVTNKYIKVESVSSSTTENVKFVENAEDATAFTLLAKETVDLTGVYPAVTGDCDFALVANIDETTGYLCATSSDKDYVTHFDRYNHRGAWVKIVEAPDYFSKIMDMGTMLGYRFGAGDSKCVIAGTNIEEVDNAMQNSGSITLNKLNDYAARMEAAMATENPTWFNVTTSAENGAAYITLENDDPELTSKRVPGGYKLTVKATPATGYHFTGWTMNGTAIEGATEEHTFTVTEATTIVASFAINTYTVNVTAGENGSATASATTVEHGSEVTLTATPSTGYSFAGWYDGENLISAEAGYTFPVTSVINYTARFEEEAGETPTTYTIRIETEGLSNDKFAAFIYTGITQDETQKSYELGSDVKLIAVQDNNDVGSLGYAFVGWFLGETLVSENDEFDFKVTGDVTYKAKFVEGIRVSVRAERGWPSIYLLNSDKEVGGTSMSTLLVPGRQLNLSVNPEFGCRFVHWTVGDNVVSTENPFTTEPLNEAVTFKAICEPASYQLIVRANYDERGTVSATSGTSTGTTIQVGHNMEATITAEPAEGFRFVEWTKGTDVVSESATYTVPAIDDVTAMNDVEYVAVFEEGAEEPVVDPFLTACYRLRWKSASNQSASNQYLNVNDHGTHNDGTYGGVGVAAKDENSNAQIFFFEASDNGYKMKDKNGYYIKGWEWNVDANSTDAANGSVLLFEETDIENEFYIKWYSTADKYKGQLKYFKVGYATNTAINFPYCDASKADAAVWVLEKVADIISYTVTDEDGNKYSGIYLGTAGVDKPTFTGVYEYELTNEAWNGVNYTADIVFPVPLENVMILPFEGSTGIRYYVDANNNVKATKTLPGANATAPALDDYLWKFEPLFNNGKFTFKIKSVVKNAYMTTAKTTAGHGEGYVKISTVATDTPMEFTIAEGNRLKIEGLTNLYLSTGSSSNSEQYAGIYGYTGSQGNHTGIINKFSCKDGTYRVVDNAGNVHEGEYDNYIVTFNGAYGYTLSDVSYNADVFEATINLPFTVSKEGETPNEILLAIYSENRYLHAVGNNVKVQTTNVAQVDINCLWAIYPECENGNFKFAIKNVSNGKYIYSAANDEQNILQTEGTVMLSTIPSKFEYIHDGSYEGLKFADRTKLYLSINGQNDTDVLLGVHKAIHKGTDIFSPSFNSYGVTIGNAGYATFYAEKAVNIPTDVEAYYLVEEGINASERYVSLTKLENGVIPAGEAVVLKAEKGTYTFEFNATSTETIENNLFEGTVAATYIEDDAYVLSVLDGEIGLYLAWKNFDENYNKIGEVNGQKIDSKYFLNNGHKIYLPKSVVPSAAALSAGFRFMFGTTAIEDVDAEDGVDTIYDLTGRKLEGISGTGIYIINGKKVIVR